MRNETGRASSGQTREGPQDYCKGVPESSKISILSEMNEWLRSRIVILIEIRDLSNSNVQTGLPFLPPNLVDDHNVLSMSVNDKSILYFAWVSPLRVSFSHTLYPMSGNLSSAFPIQTLLRNSVSYSSNHFLYHLLLWYCKRVQLPSTIASISLPPLWPCITQLISTFIFIYLILGRILYQFLWEVC